MYKDYRMLGDRVELRLMKSGPVSIRPPHPDLLRFLEPYSGEVIEIALRLRDLSLEVLPDAHEQDWDAISAVAIGFSYGKGHQDGVCHIAAYTKHVNLGFNFGASLSDPHALLKGTGSQIRHITVKTVEEIGLLPLKDYLVAALADNQSRFPHLYVDPPIPTTTIRVMAGPKRRPVAN